MNNLCVKDKNKKKEKFEEMAIFPLIIGKVYIVV